MAKTIYSLSILLIAAIDSFTIRIPFIFTSMCKSQAFCGPTRMWEEFAASNNLEQEMQRWLGNSDVSGPEIELKMLPQDHIRAVLQSLADKPSLSLTFVANEEVTSHIVIRSSPYGTN